MNQAASYPNESETFSGLPTFSASSILSLPPTDRRLFQAYGRGPTVAPPFTDIGSAFSQRVGEQPDAVAVEHANESLTYSELNTQANELAVRLTNYGVSPATTSGSSSDGQPRWWWAFSPFSKLALPTCPKTYRLRRNINSRIFSKLLAQRLC